MKYVYTAVFNLEPETKETYNVTFPDLAGCHTFGANLNDALDMAHDALCLWLYHMEQEKKEIPAATPPSRVKVTGDEFVTAISADTEFYHRFYSTKLVRKTLNIPMWLNEQAIKANVNFSGILTDALKLHLQIQK